MPKSIKRRRSESNSPDLAGEVVHIGPVRRDLLGQTYATVLTLRDYALLKLPSKSRLRRKKIAAIGHRGNITDLEARLSQFLDSTLVCSRTALSRCDDSTWEQWKFFSQNGDDSRITLSDGVVEAENKLSELVDFVVWQLFERERRPGFRPKHLLCDGFRKRTREGDPAGVSIQDVFSLYFNHHVTVVKQEPWPHLLALLGASGEKTMLDLLTERSIFVPIDAGIGNYYQLSGHPLSELDLNGRSRIPYQPRGLSDIVLVRNRIFYAKPALTASGRIESGFKHIHVLNRCRHDHDTQGKLGLSEFGKNEASTSKLMMYIFPRQFGLHNAFTSDVNPLETTHKFLDYTMREEEIARIVPGSKFRSADGKVKLPRRLRGEAWSLVQRLQVLHRRCSYFELLKHYCPLGSDRHFQPEQSPSAQGTGLGFSSSVRASDDNDTTTKNINDLEGNDIGIGLRQKDTSHHNPSPVIKLATSASQVSAFCQAVLCSIMPNDFWGEGQIMWHNRSSILRKVDHFIRLRRFESMTLHEITQDLKVADIGWLQPPDLRGQKTSLSDMNKRHELLNELLYFVFDSLLIPLIRANFYVTESSTHRYQIFFFRHDAWREVAGPSLSEMKKKIFEELRPGEANKILNARRLGFSHVRLLPKGHELRPIMNLRRRQMSQANSKRLIASINSVLSPVHTALRFEKDANSRKLGSTLFSVSDMYSRLKRFKRSISSCHNEGLFFAKVDVKSAFDTIPQDAIVQLMKSVPSQKRYKMTRHAEVQPGERAMNQSAKAGSKAIRRWRTCVLTHGQETPFATRLHNGLANKKKHTVFVDGVAHSSHETEALLSLLTEHVERNLVKIGKKYYRQKRGIPQGSVLSSFLCNYFYADLEREHLSFLLGPDCLLMRLIDDFLLITLDKGKAVRFVQTMHQGLPDYGVQVSLHKSLVNFDMQFRGETIPRTTPGQGFPYCGTRLNDQTLEISKDADIARNTATVNSLTIEYGRSPGQNFQRKILNAFKIQSHLMFFDTSHNTMGTVLESLRHAFSETARKMVAYIRYMYKKQRPSSRLIIGTICKVAQVAFSLLSSKSRRLRYPEYACVIRKGQVTKIAYAAFLAVLQKHQTNHVPVIEWLQGRCSSNKASVCP